MQEAKYAIGQIVRHRLFGYRGVIFDADPRFEGSEEWYEKMAKSRPPRDNPWYRVLVDGGKYETYVAERNIVPDESGEPIEHPLVEAFFDDFRDGKYHVARNLH